MKNDFFVNTYIVNRSRCVGLFFFIENSLFVCCKYGKFHLFDRGDIPTYTLTEDRYNMKQGRERFAKICTLDQLKT